MHISEGLLSAPVLIGGATATAVGVGYGLKKMKQEQVPEVAVMTAAFFVVTLVHIPLGPTSAHLIFNGPLGIILGWSSFPAVLVALFLQAILFQHGGLTTLGVNTANIALPALLAYFFLKPLINSCKEKTTYIVGFLAGATTVALSALLVAFTLIAAGRQFWAVAAGELAIHMPLSVIEGLLAAGCVVYLKKLRPDILKLSDCQE